MPVTVDDILRARENIRQFVRTTPLHYSEFLSDYVKASVFLKLENQQITGSFKSRGALNKMMALSNEERSRGVVTASTGNHGLGTAFAAKQLGLKASVVFPVGASAEKREKLKMAGANVIQEVGYSDIEHYARNLALERDLTYISPYNDVAIIAGAGTVGVEITEQLKHIDAVVVPIGGGGLISGIAIAVKAFSPKTQIIGVQPEVSHEIHDSWKAGHWIHTEETESVAQGLMGGVEPDSITLDIIIKCVDNILLVRETTILEAIRSLYKKESMVIEGAGAASVAALLDSPDEFEGMKVVAVISGGNISEQQVRALIGE